MQLARGLNVTGQNPSFPRWPGPIIGGGVGVALGLRLMLHDAVVDWIYLACGALLGAVAGSLVWLIDAPTEEGQPASIAGTLLAVLALCLGCMPVFGLLFGIPAFLVNRRVVGWQNRASRLALGLGVVLTFVVIVGSQVPLR